MEIIRKRTVVKLDKEERDNLIATIDLLDNIEKKMPCIIDCPFKNQCYQESDSQCLLSTIKEGLLYINNNCD